MSWNFNMRSRNPPVCQCGTVVSVVARWSFWHRSCNLPISSCLLDPLRRGALLILASPAPLVRMWRFDWDIVRAAILSLCMCQNALLVAQCSFWYRSRNHPVTLGRLTGSHCGAVFFLVCFEKKCKQIFMHSLDGASTTVDAQIFLHGSLWKVGL